MQPFSSGGNNLRHGQEDTDAYAQKIDCLLKSLNEFENLKLVLASLLPSPKTDKHSKDIFKNANKKLKELAKCYEFVSFLNISKHFCVSGKLQLSKFKSDRIHLSSSGGLALAKAIHGNILCLASKFKYEKGTNNEKVSIYL